MIQCGGEKESTTSTLGVYISIHKGIRAWREKIKVSITLALFLFVEVGRADRAYTSRHYFTSVLSGLACEGHLESAT